ncbi:MAG: hypothetical protein ACFE9M_03170 [Promethearchaeota archaeon]
MPNKNRNYNIDCIKIYTAFLIVSLLLIPSVLSGTNFNDVIDDPNLKISDFSKDDYNPILTVEKYGLGNITLYDVDFSELEEGFKIYNDTYPDIWEDHNSGALNMTQQSMQFVETIDLAVIDNLNDNIEDNDIITVKLNESISVEYNDSAKGYLIYHPRLNPSRLLEFYVDNGTNIFELNSEDDYTIDNNEFIVFDYETYFQQTSYNFTMYLIWEYELYIQEWSLTQYDESELVLNEVEQNFTVKFKYFFNLYGKKFGQTIQDNLDDADNIYVALTMNLPDKNLLNDHNLVLNDIPVDDINDHLNPDYSVNILLSDRFSPNMSSVLLNFTSLFTLKFVNPVENTWAIDRLVSMGNIRERIYFPSIIAGPKHIYLKYLSIYEYTVHTFQIIGTSSLFKRDVIYYYLNASITGREGMEIALPYLIAGETCPILIKYFTTHSLKMIITDNIKMPLVGASIEVYYYGRQYGTYISNDKSQPIAPGTTNELGEIIINNVPIGNYTIRTYYNGIFLTESTVSTENDINYIHTNYPHFPLWIMIFGMINGIILLFGALFYLKRKKMR